MKFFLVYECYDENYSIFEKGYHFLSVDDPENVDIAVGEYADAMAKARDLDYRFFVITTCQILV